MGIKDTFGKSGKAEELMKYFKITYQDIIEEVKRIWYNNYVTSRSINKKKGVT